MHLNKIKNKVAQKPSIPKGTRDFSPVEVAKRQYIIQIIKNNFEKFGFAPIETPSFENSETLLGKYGEEGDRLIFKILNSGDYLNEIKSNIEDFEFSKSFVKEIAELIKKLKVIQNIDITQYQEGSDYKKNIKDVIFADDDFIQLIKEFHSNQKNTFLVFFNNNDLALKITNNILGQILDLVILSGNIDISEFIPIIDIIVKKEFYSNLKSNSSTLLISEKALRYDLTVPFARYVVQHQNEIEFPFKRYQIQPVWRADRPQKGRFREFFQCDADVVGSKSLWQEVELVLLYDSVFSDLGLNEATIKINNRKILSGIAEVIGASDKLIDFTVALDKLDKIGEDGVKKEMIEKGISESAIEKVQPLFNFTGNIQEKIEKLSLLLASSSEGMKGVQEIKFICDNVKKLGLVSANLDLDVTLARGLNYYTGAILEVAPPKQVAMGSIGGGGRYDDLTGIFGLKEMSGVGISFGLDRIYLVIEELSLFPETVTSSTKALFLNYGEKEAFQAMKTIKKLRSLDLKVELYPDNSKIDKQFKHAERRNIPFVVIIGEKEIYENKFGLKNLITGELLSLTINELVSKLSE